MKSPVRRGTRRRNTQPVTVVNDTKYVSKISERIIPTSYYTTDDEFEKKNSNNFVNLYGIICLYIFLIIAIMIGGGGIAVCIAYYNSAENTQNWKICGIILGAATCIITGILIILTIFKQTRNRPWRYQVKDILLHPENYLSDDSDQHSTEDPDDTNNPNNQTLSTAVTSISNPSIGLLKTVHNDLVYCLGCNRLHPSSEECLQRKRIPNILPPLTRSKSLNAQQDVNGVSNKEKSLKKNKSHTTADQSIKYSLSNEIQTNALGNTANNLVLTSTSHPSSMKVMAQQVATKIMIVRVPRVPGELVIQPKEH